jgi:hypothetical protein
MPRFKLSREAVETVLELAAAVLFVIGVALIFVPAAFIAAAAALVLVAHPLPIGGGRR